MRYNLYRNWVMDAEFREEEHPRDDDGKFTDKAGGSEKSSVNKEKMKDVKGSLEYAIENTFQRDSRVVYRGADLEEQEIDGKMWFSIRDSGLGTKMSEKEIAKKLKEIAERVGKDWKCDIEIREDDKGWIYFVVDDGENKKLDNGGSGGKVYKNTMSKVRKFKAKTDGTYDFETGKVKEYPDGYSVSFHQNEPDENGKWKSDYGRYTEEDYDKNVADLVKESGGELNIGYFSGTPEVSVWVKGIREAKKLMKKHNQKSIWDWKAMDEIPNPKYDPKKNPMKE